MSRKRTLPLPRIGMQYHRNLTPTGKCTSTPGRHMARYIAFGKSLQAEENGKLRGQWLDVKGQSCSHESVLGWLRQEAIQYRYTGEVVLSVPKGKLQGIDYSQAMQSGGKIEDWRLMAHEDSAYSHAHVLFFRNKRMSKAQFLAWREKLQIELARLEEKQLDSQAVQMEITPETERYVVKNRELEAGLI